MIFSSIRRSLFTRLISPCLIVTFITTMVITPKAQAGVMGLPQPGTMVDLSPSYVPLMLTGLTVHPKDPLLMDFIVSTGNSGLNANQVKRESDRLIKYFLACLTIPENDQWVNLSPYEKQRIVPEDLGQTVLGQDMLAQDYLLKQLTASLIYPEKNLGKKFWDKVYAKASQMYGTTQIPVNTFNKVWILPDTAKVFEHKDTVFVVKSHLKVMLDEDYLALSKNTPTRLMPMRGPSPLSLRGAEGDEAISERTSNSVEIASSQKAPRNDTNLSHNKAIGPFDVNALGSQIIRQLILPSIEQEVNTGKNFAQLRQIYNSMILAVWFKKNLKQALLNQVYTDKAKINGVNTDDPAIKEKIYQQYLQAYKKGVFNYIKEEPADMSLRGGVADEAISKGTTIPRKYFSGGITPVRDLAMATTEEAMDALGRSAGPSFIIHSKAYGAPNLPQPKHDISNSIVFPDDNDNNYNPDLPFYMNRAMTTTVLLDNNSKPLKDYINIDKVKRRKGQNGGQDFLQDNGPGYVQKTRTFNDKVYTLISRYYPDTDTTTHMFSGWGITPIMVAKNQAGNELNRDWKDTLVELEYGLDPKGVPYRDGIMPGNAYNQRMTPKQVDQQIADYFAQYANKVPINIPGAVVSYFRNKYNQSYNIPREAEKIDSKGKITFGIALVHEGGLEKIVMESAFYDEIMKKGDPFRMYERTFVYLLNRDTHENNRIAEYEYAKHHYPNISKRLRIDVEQVFHEIAVENLLAQPNYTNLREYNISREWVRKTKEDLMEIGVHLMNGEMRLQASNFDNTKGFTGQEGFVSQTTEGLEDSFSWLMENGYFRETTGIKGRPVFLTEGLEDSLKARCETAGWNFPQIRNILMKGYEAQTGDVRVGLFASAFNPLHLGQMEPLLRSMAQNKIAVIGLILQGFEYRKVKKGLNPTFKARMRMLEKHASLYGGLFVVAKVLSNSQYDGEAKADQVIENNGGREGKTEIIYDGVGGDHFHMWAPGEWIKNAIDIFVRKPKMDGNNPQPDTITKIMNTSKGRLRDFMIRNNITYTALFNFRELFESVPMPEEVKPMRSAMKNEIARALGHINLFKTSSTAIRGFYSGEANQDITFLPKSIYEDIKADGQYRAWITLLPYEFRGIADSIGKGIAPDPKSVALFKHWLQEENDFRDSQGRPHITEQEITADFTYTEEDLNRDYQFMKKLPDGTLISQTLSEYADEVYSGKDDRQQLIRKDLVSVTKEDVDKVLRFINGESSAAMTAQPVNAYKDLYERFGALDDLEKHITQVAVKSYSATFLTPDGQLLPTSKRLPYKVRGETHVPFGVAEVSFIPEGESRTILAVIGRGLKKVFPNKIFLVPPDRLHLTIAGPLTQHSGLGQIDSNKGEILRVRDKARSIKTPVFKMHGARLNFNPESGIYLELMPYLTEPTIYDPLMQRRKRWGLPESRPPHITVAYFMQAFTPAEEKELRAFLNVKNKNVTFGNFALNNVQVIAFSNFAFAPTENDPGFRVLEDFPLKQNPAMSSPAQWQVVQDTGVSVRVGKIRSLKLTNGLIARHVILFLKQDKVYANVDHEPLSEPFPLDLFTSEHERIIEIFGDKNRAMSSSKKLSIEELEAALNELISGRPLYDIKVTYRGIKVDGKFLHKTNPSKISSIINPLREKVDRKTDKKKGKEKTKGMFRLEILREKRDFIFIAIDYENAAMTTEATPTFPGGIDLNSRNLNMESTGQKIDLTFDPAMVAQFKRGDFSGVKVKILDVVPISIMPLLGLKEGEEPRQLAKA